MVNDDLLLFMDDTFLTQDHDGNGLYGAMEEHTKVLTKENNEAYCEDSEEPVVLSETKTRLLIRDCRAHLNMPLSPFANRREWELFHFIHNASLSRKDIDDLLNIEHVHPSLIRN